MKESPPKVTSVEGNHSPTHPHLSSDNGSFQWSDHSMEELLVGTGVQSPPHIHHLCAFDGRWGFYL